MGIDIGFVDEDLECCDKARCKDLRNRVLGFVELEEGQEWWQGLRAHRLDSPTVHQDTPQYHRTSNELDPDHFAVLGHLQRTEVEAIPEGEADEHLLGPPAPRQQFHYTLVPHRVMERRSSVIEQPG